MTATWVALLALTSPHGVKGAMHAKPLADLSTLADYETLTDTNGAAVKLRIIGGTAAKPIVTIDGVTDRNAAELWRGKQLGVPRAALKIITQADTYYIADLVGMVVMDAGGAPLGEVIHVANYGAGDILEIRFADGHEEMFAFTKVTFPSIDPATRRITLVPPTLLGADEREDDDNVA